MKFLHPEFLFGLFTLAIPVIIHLFNFRKAKVIYFSSTRFLENINQATSKKRLLKHYLVLISRILFLTFLTLAFAQPYFPGAEKNPQAETVYIYLDNSSSMTNKVDESTTGLGLGKDYIDRILKLYPANTSYKVLTNDFLPFSNTLKSMRDVEEMLTELHESPVARTLQEATSRLQSTGIDADGAQHDVFIISDFQRSTIGQIDTLPFDSMSQVFISPILYPAMGNVFVDSVFLSSPYLIASDKNQIHVVLMNTGTSDIEDLPMKFYVNELQTVSSVVSVPAGRTYEMVIEITFPLLEVNKCRISLEDYPLMFDNNFYFTLKTENLIKVLEINASGEKTAVQLVYGNEQLFSVTAQAVTNLDYSLIRQHDFVIVNGLETIDNSLSAELLNFLQEGGSLLLIPSESPDIVSYSMFIPNLKVAAPDTTFTDMSPPKPDDPFFTAMFEELDENIQMPRAKAVISWAGEQQTLLRMRNNTGFMATFQNNGTVHVLASPLNEKYTNIHRHALFLPIMYRLATQSKKVFEKLYYAIDEPLISHTLDSLNKQDIFRLVGGSPEQELIPNQHISGNRLLLEIPADVITPGFYSLILNGQTKATLACNLQKAESYSDQWTMDEITATFKDAENVVLFQANDADNFSNEVKKNKFGVPLWKYAIVLSLFFLLAEILLIRLL
jgi:hypothetical protein